MHLSFDFCTELGLYLQFFFSSLHKIVSYHFRRIFPKFQFKKMFKVIERTH